MKITIITGSPKKDNSICSLIATKLCDQIEQRTDNKFECKIIKLSDYDIGETDGSSKEFVLGKTLYDDDMQYIESELLSADVVIFISPVYAHNVGSHMKKFIDRISYWLHIYKLIGKRGMVVSVSSNNGNEQVNEYLGSMMEYLGMNVLSKTSIETVSLKQDINLLNSYIEFMASQIMNCDYMHPNISYTQATNFKYLQNHYSKIVDGFEKTFWENNNYFDYEDFEDLFKSKIGIKQNV